MRFRPIIKVATPIPVVFATWFLTSILMAQPDYPQPLGRMTVVDSSTPRPQGTPLKKFISYERKGFDVHVLKDQAVVTATVEILAKNWNHLHLWRLQVLLEDGGVIEMPYYDQIFEMNPSGRMSPTFSEIVPLPPGKHHVLLHLYEFQPGYDATRLQNQAQARNAIVISCEKWIEVN